MALKKLIEIMGLAASDAYYQITAIKEIGKNGATIVAEGFTNDKKEHSFYKNEFSFDYDINGANPIAQGYVYLKTLPEFAGATDC